MNFQEYFMMDLQVIDNYVNNQQMINWHHVFKLIKEYTNYNEDDTVLPILWKKGSDRENLKKILEEKLVQFNTENKSKAMNIVLFQEAVHYICKINCIINLGKGHGMLVGEDGAGRHSLTKLATHIPILKNGVEEVGFKGVSEIFILSDNQIANEGIIEDINNILIVSEVQNNIIFKLYLIYLVKDYPQIKDRVRKHQREENKLDKMLKSKKKIQLNIFSLEFKRISIL